jgi:hypothetical protein
LEVVGFTNAAQGVVQVGAQVDYFYTVTNSGTLDVIDVFVVDDQGLEVNCPQDTLLVNESMVCTASAFILEDTVNIATATGFVPGDEGSGSTCQAEDSATVTILPPPPCNVDPAMTLKFGKKHLEWEGGAVATIESVTVEWPTANGNLKKVKLDGDTIFEQELPPPAATIGSGDWINSLDKRQIEPGDTAKLKIEFVNNIVKITKDYAITVNFEESCSVTFEPLPGGDFQCEKPIDALSMIWDGTQSVRIKAWKGNPGSLLLADIDNVAIGDEVTVSGFAGSPNDVVWEVFEAGTSTKIGESKFHLSCSDNAMNGPEDCGARQGDGKGNDANLINDWIFEGMVGAGGTLDCSGDSTGNDSPVGSSGGHVGEPADSSADDARRQTPQRPRRSPGRGTEDGQQSRRQ